jgi:hypothetical protein
MRWFYHTVRTQANFYESCLLRDRLHAMAHHGEFSAVETAQARQWYARWRQVLEDERANATAALPLMQHDMRLDWYFGGDHSFPHGEAMLKAKLALLDEELNIYLPALARQRTWD